MKTFRITVPVTGTITKEIEAENEEKALIAFEELDLSPEDISEWDWTEQIVRGNVFYGILNEMEIDEI